MKMPPRRALRAAALLAAGIGAAGIGAQVIDMTMVRSNEQLRLGVQAYHKGAFNEAIVALEKALSIKPGEPFITSWLGRAYWRSGLEGEALSLWKGLSDAGKASASLNALADGVRARRLAPTAPEGDPRLVVGAEYPGTSDGRLLFQRLSSIMPLEDAGAIAVSYGTNEVLRFDANGFIAKRWRGPFAGLDRPFDVARAADGKLYVTEFAGNRICVLGADGGFLRTFGSKGRGDGQFVAPGYIAIGGDGAVYVVDYGNLRVQKFDPEGNFLLKFGAAAGAFGGFRSPTGVLAAGGKVYVADSGRKAIAVFDPSGNFEAWIGEGEFLAPEGISKYDDRSLLVADSRRIVRLDLDTERAAVLFALGDKEKGRITRAAREVNGGVIASDFDASRALLLHDLSDMYAGLLVTIDRIDASAFPKVYLGATVRDRTGRPITGLGPRNFNLSEYVRKFPGDAAGALKTPADLALYSANYADPRLHAALVVERSAATAVERDKVRDAASFVAAPFGKGDELSLVGAGAAPTLEQRGDAVKSALGAARGEYAADWKFDLAVRLAGNELAPRAGRKVLFYVGTGKIDDAGFARYSLAQLAAYLGNNDIEFVAVLLDNAPPDAELSYLCAQTGGAAYYAYRPEGLAPVVAGLRTEPAGGYVLSFTAASDSNFGRDYMQLALEAYLFKRSGRDELGYFAPLK